MIQNEYDKHMSELTLRRQFIYSLIEMLFPPFERQPISQHVADLSKVLRLMKIRFGVHSYQVSTLFLLFISPFLHDELYISRRST